MRGLALCLLLLPLGCYQKNGYTCTGNNECVQLGVHGTCEPSGFCAFPDSTCPAGDRYEQNAGGGLGGQCVAPGTGIDAATDSPGIGPDANCGAVGMACCPSGAACIDNAFCASGTCKQCIIDFSIGSEHTCAIKYDGTVWCSGANERGQLGGGTVGGADQPTRQQVRDTANQAVADATAIMSMDATTCILRAGGAVWCWGKNDDGQVGDGTSANNVGKASAATRASDSAPLTGMTKLGQVGHDTSCAIDAASTAWCWGENTYGNIGDGTVVTPKPRAQQVLVAAGGAAFADVASLTANDDDHACLRTNAGAIWCWGHNVSGAVGDNTVVDKPNPVHIIDGLEVVAGHSHTCAIKADHSVWCWGSGGKGRLGNGQAGDSLVPTSALAMVGGNPFGGAAQLAAGGVSCSLQMNGDLYCWGMNAHGQTGTLVGVTVPTPVVRDTGGAPLHGVSRVMANYATTCAFTNDGNLLCWGKNASGQIGDGTKKSRIVPASIPLTCP